MNVDFRVLQEMHRLAAADETSGSDDPCPPAEQILRLCAGREFFRKDARRVTDHLARCASCAAEAQAFLRTMQEMENTIDEFGRIAPRRLRPKRVRITVPRWLPRPVFVVSIAVLLIGLSAMFLMRTKATQAVWRGSSPEVHLLSPGQESLESAGWEFTWRAFPGAEAYYVEIFDSTGSRVWKSARVSESRITFPEERRPALMPGETYFWTASAVLKNGAIAKSRLMEFVSRK
jgi:hypothetical protein